MAAVEQKFPVRPLGSQGLVAPIQGLGTMGKSMKVPHFKDIIFVCRRVTQTVSALAYL